MPNNAELLQVQQPLVQHTTEICLNVSCNNLPSSYNKTVTFLRLAKLYRMLTRCIVFIYIPNTKEMTFLLEFYVAGSYVTKNWRFYISEQITRKLLGTAIIQMGYNCLYFLSGELCWLLWKFYIWSRAISETWH